MTNKWVGLPMLMLFQDYHTVMVQYNFCLAYICVFQVFHVPSSWPGLSGSCIMKTNSKHFKNKEQRSLFNLLVKTSNLSNRCWFGKEPGKYMDYIYQGPVILVLLVSNIREKSLCCSFTAITSTLYFNRFTQARYVFLMHFINHCTGVERLL